MAVGLLGYLTDELRRKSHWLMVFAMMLCGGIMVAQSSPLVMADPLPNSEQEALDNWDNWVGTSGSCSSQTVPAGTLPSFIPQPYNGAFTEGADHHDVAPALVAAIFSEEHNLGGSETNPNTSSLPGVWKNFPTQHPDPNSGWGSSSAGAEGPFQFEPATWTGYGYDLSDINNLVISADAAGKFLASNGGTKDKSDAGLRGAIYAYNHVDWYVNAVLKYYDYYNTASSSGAGSGSSATATVTSSGCAAGVTSLSPDCSGKATVKGNAEILCAAEAYEGIYYHYGSGVHGAGGFTAFEKACPASVLANAAANSTADEPGPCATDCSGLVSVAVDTAFNLNLGWNVASLESDSSNWQKINISNAQVGDVVVEGSEHVEIVEDHNGSTMHTFGSHHTGTQTSEGPTDSTDAWTGAYRYIGKGSST